MSDEWKQKPYVERYNQVFAFDDAEAALHLEPLRLASSDLFVDFGCGEGTALFVAAQSVSRVLGIDSSADQLDRARARLASLPNVQLQLASFLDCDLSEGGFTKGAARKALHHLKDADKETFFNRVSPHFTEGALFLVEDAVFDFPRSSLADRLFAVLEEAESVYGERWSKVRGDFLTMLREEYPTGIEEWTRALGAGGFKIERRMRWNCFSSALLARKGS